jgi:hypothetical protein
MLYRFQGQNGFPTGLLNQGPGIPWYDSTIVNMSNLANKPNGCSLGDLWFDDISGNWFQLVKAAAGLTIGQLVAGATPGTDTVVNAGSTVQVVNINTGNLTVNAEVGNYVYFVDPGALRLIKANTAASITVSLTDSLIGNNQADPDVLASVPGNGTALCIIRPYQVIVGTATILPVGVALGTVTSGNYTVIQKAGLAQVITVGSVTPTVVNQPAVPGASGTVVGSAAAAANLFAQGVSIIPQFAYASTSLLTPAIVNFMGG